MAKRLTSNAKAKKPTASSTATAVLDAIESKESSLPQAKRAIEIEGARQHNLKNISLKIPHDRLTVITGPSGCGKSSLAFDTLFAEGQRRFLESLSTYARQFLTRFEKPDVDHIRHILPAIALEQKNAIKNARSTVGTVTELDDFLRLLFATLGQLVDDSGAPVTVVSPESIAQDVYHVPADSRVVIAAPLWTSLVAYERLQALGYFRAFDPKTGRVADIDAGVYAKSTEKKPAWVVIDRVIWTADDEDLPARILDSLRKAADLTGEALTVFTALADSEQYSQVDYALTAIEARLASPSPHLFSFNSPLGACQACEGYGRVIGVDLNKVIPNRSLSLAEGAVHPFNSPSNIELYDLLLDEAKQRKIPTGIPYDDLSADHQAFVLKGSGGYPGVYQYFEWLESKKYKMHIRVLLSKYRSYTTCHACAGSRLKPESTRFWISGRSIFDWQSLPISNLMSVFEETVAALLARDAHKVERVVREIRSRLGFLHDIGLGYLTLSRQSRTLSGGEAQRIHLATALGSQLTDTLYVLDEPTVGLHAKDTAQLLAVLRKLRDAGNTVVVVEHDSDMILGADEIVELGPEGGRGGGYLVHRGTPETMLACPESKTGYYLQKPFECPELAGPKSTKAKASASSDVIRIVGASGHNLQNVTVDIPKGQLVCVSGVSGSGKSTLIKQTLYAQTQQQKGRELAIDACPCVAIEGVEEFADIVLVDQSPPGRSARSNPATYVKAYDDIRKLMASTREAQLYGISASDFSFNSAGGRCEKCEGLGYQEIDMQFMADVTVLCPECNGRRFSPSVLAIEYEGLAIDGILNLTIDEAYEFFASEKRILAKLQPLRDVGLGYLKLGQSTNTLSGGEAQRLKLSSYLADCSESGRVTPGAKSLLLFDEPSTGLHLSDIERLVDVFQKLVREGHSLVVIEHNIDVLIHAQTLLDLGPGGGSEGGRVVACGTVEDVIAEKDSVTGVYLAHRLGK